MEASRQPLRDIGTNSPSVKRQKLNNATLQATKHEQQRHEISSNLSDWQRSWRRIMRESVIYFDSNDVSTGDYSTIKKKEKEKAIKLFTQVGATIQQFFDHRVTIVVSRRDKADLPRNMLQYQNNLKFWNYEKVFRFLKNLGEITSPVQATQKNARHLSSLLHDEKLHGPNDRDPNAKRDDYNYFKHPYFYVYDLRNITRPVAIREWKVKDLSATGKKPWPHIFESAYGRSPFLPDPADLQVPRKVERRRQRDQQNKRYRDKLRVIYGNFDPEIMANPFSDDSEVESDSTLCERENLMTMPPPQPEPGLTLSRQPSLISNKFIEVTKRDNFEIQASGFNGSTNVSQQSTEMQTKNGLAPTGSSVASKQVNSLTKKLIVRKQKLSNSQISKAKQKVAGYCENCRIHFDDFDEHIESGKHRSFALEDSNFKDIDDLIDKLNDDIVFKR